MAKPPPGTTRALLVDSARLRWHGFRLVALASPASPERHADAVDGAITVGTDEGNTLRLDDATVSRHHFEIRAGERGFELVDLGSTNGTFLGPHRVFSALVDDGAEITAGQTRLRFQVLAADATEASLAPGEEQDGALGRSAEMRRIFALLPRLAATDSTVLIEGETGTGKSMLAEMIHRQSARAARPFMVVDCSAIPAALIESELFGHEKGAFTGATSASPGVLAAAAGGTVFLDEIGELPVDMQPKLLRALEERQIRRVGGTQQIKLDVRVVAATNRDLRAEVNKGGFRSDLYYRLNVLRLRVPPLRERREDISLLATHYYKQFKADDEAQPPAALLAALRNQPWPGNVRELRAAVERAVFMGDFRDLTGTGTPPAAEAPAASNGGDDDAPFRVAKERVVAEWERRYLVRLMERALQNVSRAARLARMDRTHLRELLIKYDMLPTGRDP